MNEMFSLGWTLFTVTKLHWCKLNIPLLFLQWSRQLPPRRYLVSSHISQLKSVQTWWMVSLSWPGKNWVRKYFQFEITGPWLHYWPLLLFLFFLICRQWEDITGGGERVVCPVSGGGAGLRDVAPLSVNTRLSISSPAAPGPGQAWVSSACQTVSKNQTIITITIITNKEK